MLKGEDIGKLVEEHLQPDVKRCCEPRASAVDFYNETYRTYQRAVEQVAALYT